MQAVKKYKKQLVEEISEMIVKNIDKIIDQEEDDFVNAKQAMEYLNITNREFEKMRKNGLIREYRPYKMGRIYYKQSELAKLRT